MKKAIITGATGFIGSNLCKHLLDNNWEVSIISRPSSSYKNLENIMDKINIFEFDGDLSSLVSFFKKTKADAVFHLAAVQILEHKISDIDTLIDGNIKLGMYVLEAMRLSETKIIVNTGTYWQYYNSNAYNPANLYAATKQAFEDLIKYYADAENVKAVTLKLFDTYGAGDTRPKLVNLLHKFADENKKLDMSPGEQELDYVYIDDIMEAFSMSYEYVNNNNLTYLEFAVASGRRMQLKNLVELFEQVTGKKVNINWGGKIYREREVMKPWSNYKTLPGWECKVSLEEGLKLL